MIIDFTRSFTEEQRACYEAILVKWNTAKVVDYLNFDDESVSAELYPERDKLSEEDLAWLKELEGKAQELMSHFRSERRFTAYSLTYVPRLRVFKWLLRNNYDYELLYHPHPSGDDLLFLKNDEVSFEFRALFKQLPNMNDIKYLESKRGYTIVILRDTEVEQILHMVDSCVGCFIYVEEKVSHITRNITLAFELIEDAVLFKTAFA
jgi:hypothetical protein